MRYTVEQLDAMPIGTVLTMSKGAPFVKDKIGWRWLVVYHSTSLIAGYDVRDIRTVADPLTIPQELDDAR